MATGRDSTFTAEGITARVLRRGSSTQSHGEGEYTTRWEGRVRVSGRGGREGSLELAVSGWYTASERHDQESQTVEAQLPGGRSFELWSEFDYEKYRHAQDHDRWADLAPVVAHLRELGWDVDAARVQAFVRAAARKVRGG
ncbi:MAG: hypothetical protein M9894_06020 [Planctomycetes bacterium]|nr:hypothetical protein [Planctomycetota bacterium]